MCSVSYSNKFIECEKVFYCVPLSCEKKYVGRTGRCVNTRLREHNYNCKQITHPGNLATHCNRCQCHPKFDSTKIVSRCHSSKEREIIEAFTMNRNGVDTCVSAPSLSLTEAEVSFLEDKVAHRHRETWTPDYG